MSSQDDSEKRPERERRQRSPISLNGYVDLAMLQVEVDVRIHMEHGVSR